MSPSRVAVATITLLAASLAHAADPSVSVLPVEDVDWQALNPARGDQSPKAATLWGDRNGSGPTGFLVRFVDGFSSPPHIHNVSYRGVVIHGLVHNADAKAPEMWMSAPSFWTQPKGAAHITAAKGAPVTAYIEIDEGPYLVHPVDKAFETPERPVNVDASNLVWLDVASVAWMADASGPAAKVAFLWGTPGEAVPSGALVQLPSGFEGSLHAPATELRSVIVQGRSTHRSTGEPVTLGAGSTFVSTGEAEHHVACVTPTPCVLYVRSEGAFRVTK